MLKSLSRVFRKGFKRSPEERLRSASLIACDLDGTLLDRHERLPETTAGLIRRVEAEGVRFLLITRRHHQAVEPYAVELGLSEPVISLDGALTCAAGGESPIDSVSLDMALTLGIAEEVKHTEGVECAVVTPAGFFSTCEDIALPTHHEHWNIDRGVVESLVPLVESGHILEVIVVGGFYMVNSVLDYLERAHGGEDLKLRMYESHTRGDCWYLEVRSAGATKLNALGRLLERYGMGFDSVVGIGDNFNDLDFCRKAGYVVAVLNAVEDLRRIADYVTKRDYNHGGVDEFLRYFLEVRARRR